MKFATSTALTTALLAASAVNGAPATLEDPSRRLLNLFGNKNNNNWLGDILGQVANIVQVQVNALPNIVKSTIAASWDWHKFGGVHGPGLPKPIPWSLGGNSESWATFKGNGVNLGGWMELEAGQQPAVFALAPGSPDEWTLCKNLGDRCGPVLEEHYKTWYTKADIDRLAKYGINILRVPTTYQAWVDVPGSELYHGNQQQYLADLLDYAAGVHNMKIIIGLHSLPGGVNSLDIGEAFGHNGWFFNATNFDYSMAAVNNTLAWINQRPQKVAFSLSPLNEAGDDLSRFGSPNTLSTNATAWVATYFKTVYASIQKMSPGTYMVLQDCFSGSTYWSSLFDRGNKIIIDTHVYYFAAAGVYANYAAPAICGQASSLPDKKFPVFVGEWSLQTNFNNTLAGRKLLLQTQQYAWAKYVSGGSFWSARFNGTTPVDGEGTQKDYWTYLDFIDQGLVNEGGKLDSVYCS
ncbi:unnamed protein product [Parajaminaea phylloscopi]